jgi:hypothetical protein
VVVAPGMADVVRFAGGWLFDVVMAGWEALVLTADGVDARPLRILGARPLDLEADLATSVRVPGPNAIAADARLCESDERVRQVVLSAVDSGSAEVRLWGDHWPTDLGDEVGLPRQHQLSVAAQAFKAQAMAAAGVENDHTAEVFRHPTRHLVSV